MARIAGVNLPKEKRIEVALTYVFGIGRSLSTKILEKTGVDKDIKVKDLSEGDVDKLRQEISKHTTEGDLRRKTLMDIKRLQEINCLRGYRHRRGLPVRGQQTQTNARTRKGKRKTVANKKQVGK